MRVHFVVLALVFLHGSARGARLGTAGLQTIAADSGPLSNQQGGPVVQQELLKAAGLFDDRGTWAGLEEDLQHIVIMVEQQVRDMVSKHALAPVCSMALSSEQRV